ncbi:hypothetical protein C6H66_24385 [Photorhabdus hindustanensis]|uniref:Uncharacterized protein n=1 Tax=Photorhabdus hindustanensis TaxID=2918802 RepID=A0A2S8PTX8_9GAMM|nr:hypothetical protein C6H66_24385 [Photorhabdus hindustanensis]
MKKGLTLPVDAVEKLSIAGYCVIITMKVKAGGIIINACAVKMKVNIISHWKNQRLHGIRK